MNGKNTKKKALKNDNGIALIALVSIIVMVLAVAYAIIYYIFWGANENIGNITQVQAVIKEREKEKVKIREEGLDTRIVSTLTEENVPIPLRFSYVKGDKKTGIIIKSNDTGFEYLYIPYDESAKTDSSDYYKEVSDYNEMDVVTLSSIKKYDGFFVELTSSSNIEELKKVNKKEYFELLEGNNFLFDDYWDSVNPHLLYKEEIAQINSYLKTNKIDVGKKNIGVQALTIEPFSEVNPNELVTLNGQPYNELLANKEAKNQNIQLTKVSNNNLTKVASTKASSKNDYVYMYKTKSSAYGGSSSSKAEIPIPKGFEFDETDGIVMIRDEDNKNMIYIWVPVSLELEEYKNNTEIYVGEVKAALIDLYKKAYDGKEPKDKIKDLICDSVEDLDEDFIESLHHYKGFYISQAELSYANDDKDDYMNIARGMENSTVTQTVQKGNYFRANNVATKSEDVYKEMKEIAEDSNDQSSVVSHLMYGLEYDLTMLWLADTNEDEEYNDKYDIYEVLCKRSSDVGKYKDTKNLKSTMKNTEMYHLNYIYGLGGNLAEVTQESYKSSFVTRGGSYSDKGEEHPIASRRDYTSLLDKNVYITGDNKNTLGENIGFRTALYIKFDEDTPEVTTKDERGFNYSQKSDIVEVKVEDKEEKDEKDEKEEVIIEEIAFDEGYQEDNYVKKVNGANIFVEANKGSSVKNWIDFTQKVVVIKKAQKLSADGIQWVYVTTSLDNGTTIEGFMDEADLTNSTTPAGNNNFVIADAKYSRNYKAGLIIYSDSELKTQLYPIPYSGTLYNIVGKSTDKKVTMYEINNSAYAFVDSTKLIKEDHLTIQVEGYTFIVEDNINAWVKNDGTDMNSTLNFSTNSITKLDKNTHVYVTGKSINNDMLQVRDENGKTGYIKYDDLTTQEPTIEPENDTPGDVPGDVTPPDETEGEMKEEIYGKMLKPNDKAKLYSVAYVDGTLGGDQVNVADLDGKWLFLTGKVTKKSEEIVAYQVTCLKKGSNSEEKTVWCYAKDMEKEGDVVKLYSPGQLKLEVTFASIGYEGEYYPVVIMHNRSNKNDMEYGLLSSNYDRNCEINCKLFSFCEHKGTDVRTWWDWSNDTNSFQVFAKDARIWYGINEERMKKIEEGNEGDDGWFLVVNCNLRLNDGTNDYNKRCLVLQVGAYDQDSAEKNAGIGKGYVGSDLANSELWNDVGTQINDSLTSDKHDKGDKGIKYDDHPAQDPYTPPKTELTEFKYRYGYVVGNFWANRPDDNKVQMPDKEKWDDEIIIEDNDKYVVEQP